MPTTTREGVSAVQVTFDSDEPIERVIEVIKALYGLEIEIQWPKTGKMKHD